MEMRESGGQQTITVPLTGGREVRLSYPAKVTAKEVNKIRRVVRVMFDTIVVDDTPPATPTA